MSKDTDTRLEAREHKLATARQATPAWREALEGSNAWNTLVQEVERRGYTVEYAENGVTSDITGKLAARLLHAFRGIVPGTYRVDGTYTGRFVANVSEA